MAKNSETEWADILGPTREFEYAVTHDRRLEDLPYFAADGAKEIALLSIFKEEQRFAFEPVIRALSRLKDMTDWSLLLSRRRSRPLQIFRLAQIPAAPIQLVRGFLPPRTRTSLG
jgi:hypothetical protein